ncbi:MAG: hypothetical protein NUV97_02125 [archaeon]|nr:hypothetical protein [archaeon]MCR4323748.1 hypothetical protein [Nanoarchaeota archaeon]
MVKTKIYIWAGIGVMIVLVILMFSGANSYPALENFKGEVNLYKEPTCGCCGVYSTYMSGDLDVKVITGGVDQLKDKYNIPSNLRSCHTIIIGDYFVEGHIPLEAVNKLIEEKPDIAGIAMPGMPSGTPGMPGQKNGDWVIYAVNHDGSQQEFMRI